MATDTPEYLWRVQTDQLSSITFPVSIDGTPLDVTGWTVDAKVKTNPGGPTLHTIPAPMIEIDETEITLRVPQAVSSAWEFSIGWYRVRITDPDSPVDDPISYRVLQGTLLVDPD